MKKNMRFYSIAALALTGAMTLAACSADDPTADSRQPAANDGTVTMTTTVSLADGSGATRALAADGTKTFAKGDKIAFFYEDTSGQTVMAESDALADADIAPGGLTAAFTVTLSNAKAGGKVKYVYPAAMAGTADVDYSKLATQDGKLATLASTLDCATYIGNLSTTGQLPSQPQLENQLAVLALTLYDTSVSEANNVTAKVTKVTVKVGSDTYTVNRAAAAGPVYVAVKPAANAVVSYTATTSTGEYKKEQTGKNYAAGTLYKLSLKMTPSATDLSMVDCAGDARTDGAWTANCYMVHKKGDYKLPLVYGNAIKGGAANSAAWTGVSGTNTTATFPNHAGDAINAPWITKAKTGTGVNKGMGISVKDADLLWQDAQGLITKVGISGDYLTLTVGKDATTQEGNAVVAAKDASGTIVWSWHIWVTKQTFASNTLTTFATDTHTYTVTPVNLGWVGAPISKGYCTYYQWGRKDAFKPAKGGGVFTDHTVYNISGATVTGMNHISSTTATIADNIKNPSTFYTNSTSHGPCKTTYYNMWDAQQTGTGGYIDTPTKKTVYDPSPAGFCVPTSHQLIYLGYTVNKSYLEWDNTNWGYKWKKNGSNLLYPTTAERSGSDGGNLRVDDPIWTTYWSATPYDNEYGYNMFFHIEKTSSYDGINFGGSYRQNGCPVRAVVEE